MTDEQRNELDKKAFLAIQRCFSQDVLREVIKKETIASLQLKLEGLYITKSLVNKFHLKERLYTLQKVKDAPIKSHLNEFNPLYIVDLKNF